MDIENPSVPSRARSAVAANDMRSRANSHARRHPYGVIHDNTRHTTRFTVIGNDLAQHPDLSHPPCSCQERA